MSADDTKGGKVFSEDTIAVLLMALGSVGIPSAQYEMMSSLDGTKTASSFQHAFRSVLKKAKDFKARVDAGETFKAVAPSKKRAAATTATPPATPKKAKPTPKSTPRGRKKKVEIPGFEDGIEFCDEKPDKVKVKKEVKDELAGSYV